MHVMLGMMRRFIRKKTRLSPPSDRVVEGEVEALLVSFCNMTRTRKAPMAVVDLIAPSGPSYRWLNLDGKSTGNGPPNHGGRALCWYGELVCATYRTSARVAEFALFEPGSWKVLSRSPVPAGIHSAVCEGHCIYFTTSLEDSVYRASPQRRGTWRIERYWTLPGSTGAEDENHINGIALVDGKLCVSGLGRKAGSVQDSGFIYDIEAERYVVKDIHGPHSLLWDGAQTWTCASVPNKVLSLEGQRYEFPTTYLRGLVMGDGVIFAASSKRRTRSLSTGEKTGVLQDKRGECSLWKKYTDGGEAERVVDFSEHRDEIYDLLPVPSPTRTAR